MTVFMPSGIACSRHEVKYIRMRWNVIHDFLQSLQAPPTYPHGEEVKLNVLGHGSHSSRSIHQRGSMLMYSSQ